MLAGLRCVLACGWQLSPNNTWAWLSGHREPGMIFKSAQHRGDHVSGRNFNLSKTSHFICFQGQCVLGHFIYWCRYCPRGVSSEKKKVQENERWTWEFLIDWNWDLCASSSPRKKSHCLFFSFWVFSCFKILKALLGVARKWLTMTMENSICKEKFPGPSIPKWLSRTSHLMDTPLEAVFWKLMSRGSAPRGTLCHRSVSENFLRSACWILRLGTILP